MSLHTDSRSRSGILGSAFTVFCILLFVCLLANSADTAEASRFYLRLCARRVLPALFVFSTLAGVICSDPLFYRLCALPFFGAEAAVLLIAFLGGFPLGALISVQLFEDGQISRRQAEYLCAFTNNASLSFIVGYAGGVLGSAKTGIVLALLAAASSVLTALVLKFAFLGRDERRISPPRTAAKRRSLPEALSESCFTMLTVCGSIVFFGSVSIVFPERLRPFFELCAGISGCESPAKTAALLGFSGLAVMTQVAAVCSGKLSVKPYIIAKLAQSAVMGAAAHFIFR